MHTEPIFSDLNMREAGIDVIEKDSTEKGYAIVRESFLDFDDRIHVNYQEISCCQNSSAIQYRIKLKY